MAEEALKCVTSLFESVPGMIEDLESVLKTSQENQKQILQDHRGVDQPVDQLDALPRKPSISSSLKSRQSKDDSTPNALQDEPADAQAQAPQMTPADALRLAQRKRKTASNCSGKRSGPTKYRSRSLVVVYYDGDIQKRFETVVRNIGVCRNSMRKGKMNAKLDVMARSGSSGSEDSPDESLRGIRKAINGSSKIWETTALRKDDGAPAFDKADGFLDKAQTLCEKAAHQVLRDGDCALEVSNAKEHLENALKLSEAELPALQRRAEKAAEKRRLAEEKRKSQTDDKKDESLNEKVENGERYGSPPADLEVDELEVDDSEDDDDGDPSNALKPSQSSSGRCDPAASDRRAPSWPTPLAGMKSGSAAMPASLKDNVNNAAPEAGLEEPIDIDAYEKSDAYNDVAEDDRHAVNPHSVITPPNTLDTREGDSPAGSANPKPKHKYGTRAAKNGRDSSTLDKYDLKFHPADKHLRPKRAAKRRSGSKAPSAATVKDDELTDDSNASQSAANDSDSVELSEAESDESEPPVKRDPDPRAVRCSKRSAAQKFVNYSKKHHKDDYAIPGFQHKARELKQERKGSRPAVKAPKASQSKGKGGRKKLKTAKAAYLADDSAPRVTTSDDTKGFVEGVLSFVTSHVAEDYSSDVDDDPIADLERLQEDSAFAQSERPNESSSTMRGEVEFAGFSSKLMIDENGTASKTAEPSDDFMTRPSPAPSPVQGPRLPPDFEHILEQALASDGHVIPNTSSDEV